MPTMTLVELRDLATRALRRAGASESMARTTAEALVTHCREAMAPHKAPTLWFGCIEFPLTASGKVQKFKLREALGSGILHPLP